MFGKLALVGGHRVGSRVYRFPHRCPGPGCAIAAWLVQRDRVLLYRLERAEVPERLVKAIEAAS